MSGKQTLILCVAVSVIAALVYREGERVTHKAKDYRELTGWIQLSLLQHSHESGSCSCFDGGVVSMPHKRIPYARVHTVVPHNESKLVAVELDSGEKAELANRVWAGLSQPGSNGVPSRTLLTDGAALCAQACYKTNVIEMRSLLFGSKTFNF